MCNRTLSDLMLQRDCNIVILDDDNDMLKLLCKAFEAFFGNRVYIKTFSKDNSEFYKYIDRVNIDLFIVDMVIGNGLDGLQISEKIINNKRGRVFLFISGHSHYDISTFDGLSGTCIYDFMAKPFSVDEFLSACVSLINISFTYELLKKHDEEEPGKKSMRQYYSRLLEKDKAMIKNLKYNFETIQPIKPVPLEKKIIF